MANDKKHPWGHVYAVVPNPKYNEQSTTSQKNRYLEVGVAWHNTSQDGKESLRIELPLMPTAWLDPNVARVLDVQKTAARGAK